jgi:DNA-binding HxlR family transcriptional regulator
MESKSCLASWCADEEWCDVACTAEVMGKKWHPVVVHLFVRRGPLGFSALRRAIDGVSDKVLTETLDDLREREIVDRVEVSQQPLRVEYTLTERGRDLEPVVAAMATWGDRHADGVAGGDD